MQEARLEANSYPWCPDIWCANFCRDCLITINSHQAVHAWIFRMLCCVENSSFFTEQMMHLSLMHVIWQQFHNISCLQPNKRFSSCVVYNAHHHRRAMSSVLEQQAAAAEAKPAGRRGSKSKASDASKAAGSASSAASPAGDWDPSTALALESLGAAGDLLPLNTAFQLLVTPSLTHGVGLRLKREYRCWLLLLLESSMSKVAAAAQRCFPAPRGAVARGLHPACASKQYK